VAVGSPIRMICARSPAQSTRITRVLSVLYQMNGLRSWRVLTLCNELAWMHGRLPEHVFWREFCDRCRWVTAGVAAAAEQV
jgi:hypothetical protein